mmetsp:Transcript_17126/g.36979  ORF Transcript_17126/g.36979 Transcript_17126/m.36979 type:complete len:271 (-) Transcript_17126:1664-2476(-)
MLCSQLLQKCDQVIYLLLSFHLVFACANVDGAILNLLPANHQLEIVLVDLGASYLLLKRRLRQIDISVKPFSVQFVPDLLAVVIPVFVDRYQHDLPGRQPEWPLAAIVLAEDREHALHAPEHRPVDDDGTCKRVPVLALRPSVVLQFEPDRELEVELHRRALMDPLHGVHDFDVDLWSVEGAVAGVFSPASLPGEGVHGARQRRLSSVPELYVPEGLLRPRAQFQLVGHSKRGVDALHEFESSNHFRFDLVLAAEDVGIVLLEPTDAREP